MITAAEQRAYERGQDDARNNRPRDNRWPTINSCHHQYESGYDDETEVMTGF
jgi:hypothetical protein